MPSSDQCFRCSNYTGAKECEAFPDGIPQEIYSGLFDHSKEFVGDNGIRFEERSDI